MTDSGGGFDNYNVWIKVAFACLNFPLIVFGGLALLALNRTRGTPETARFLSSGLIALDLLAVSGFTLRRFIDADYANTIVQIVSIKFAWLAYVTVGFMALERLVIFYSPFFYVRRVTPIHVKRVAFSIWIMLSVAYYILRFPVCYLRTGGLLLNDMLFVCNNVIYTMYTVCVCITIISSLICYLKIFLIIRNEKVASLSVTRSMRQYKATSIVFLYLVIVIVTSVAYLILILFSKLEYPLIRLSTDIIHNINCLLDPCVYVIWYRECRMEILKMFSTCFPGLKDRIETMRHEIFFIVDTKNSGVITCDARSREAAPTSDPSHSHLTDKELCGPNNRSMEVITATPQ